jgi:NTE family protein
LSAPDGDRFDPAAALGQDRMLALVLSGGGALAAYQVGVLHYLADRFPRLRAPILTGVSAGAVNTAVLAALPGGFSERVSRLHDAWAELSAESVFRVNSLHLFSRVLRSGIRLLSGKRRPVERPRSLLDTEPLRAFLRELFGREDGALPGIAENLARGEIHAVAITAMSYSTEEPTTWVQSRSPLRRQHPHRVICRTELTVEHVMASAALPFVFPAVQIDGQWYGDGGMELASPFAPAIQLGADRILSISTRYRPRRDGVVSPQPYPPPAQIAGTMLNALFLEHSAVDALRIARINRLIEHVPPPQREDLRRVELLVLSPSVDLCKLADDYEPRLPRALRHLIHGLGTAESRNNELLSLLMFQPDYLRALMEIGRADAAARGEEIAAVVESPSAQPQPDGAPR